MRKSLLFANVLLVVTMTTLGFTGAARADAAAACNDAFDQSQVKRDEGKLLEARRLLRVCSGPSCSATEQKLCTGWLTDVEARVPSFVLAARSGSGVDLVAVKVLMDGTQVAATLDGRAIDADLGPHSFVFELGDGTQVKTTAVAVERGKGKLVSVTFGQPPESAAVAPSPAPSPASRPPPEPETVAPAGPPAREAPAGEARARETRGTSEGGGSAWKTVGIVASVAGVLGLGLGTVFGVEALSTKSSHCDSNGVCEPAGSASNAYGQATVSTVGFVAGGVLLVGGVTLVLAAPRGGGQHPSASLAVAPMLGASAGGLRLTGTWW